MERGRYGEREEVMREGGTERGRYREREVQRGGEVMREEGKERGR